MKKFYSGIVLLAIISTVAPGFSAPVNAASYDDAVSAVLALPYDGGAVPQGLDSAFGPLDYPAAFPLTDTSTGTCCTGPVPDQAPLADLAPPFPEFPSAFQLIEFASADGTPLHAFAALHPGAPGLVVMHGFNTNGKYSAARYGAAMYANGYSVIVPDHRDMGREWARNGSWHPDGTRHGQTLGWKESQDLLAAAQWLANAGVDKIGALGFSEGAQNTMLAAGIDHAGLIDAILTFSGPADQSTLALRNADSTSALLTTVVNNPDLCDYLTGVGARPEFSATPNFMLRQASAADTFDGIVGGGVTAPGLHFYANDDTLVPPWNATILASRTNFMAEQHTVLLPIGNHAYFVDRYWTQLAALTWFGNWLDPAGTSTSAVPTVAAPANGTPAGAQQLSLSDVTRADGDAELRTDNVCAPASAVGPTAALSISGDLPAAHIDGRGSYSGWDDHEIVFWSIDAGDGSPATSGTNVLNAVLTHRYCVTGDFTVSLTVSDDSGRQATSTQIVSVASIDSDGDGVADCSDNCTLVANATQCDTDGDGYGNHCDADLNNNGVINFVDLGILKGSFLASPPQPAYNADADMNCNGVINFIDLGMLKGRFLQAPGPSAID